MKDPIATLQKLVRLVDKAASSNTAIPMDAVFDDPQDATAWDEAWSEARAIVKFAKDEAGRRPS